MGSLSRDAEWSTQLRAQTLRARAFHVGEWSQQSGDS